MNKKQKMLVFTVILVTVITVSGSAFFVTPPTSSDLKVVAAFYPLTYLSQEIGGDYVEVTQLIPSNTEIHTWEPAASHIMAAEDADILVYNGAGADHWMEDDILPSLSSTKTRMVVKTTSGLNLLLSSQEHETVETENEHSHGLYDPHTWISPYMTKLQAEKIYEAFVQKDPEHEDYYYERWMDLKDRLEEIDNEYVSSLAGKGKDEIFVSHSAFGYLAYRYNFKQHGIIGLSADEQPSAAMIARLVNLMREHETFVIYVDPVFSTDYANMLKNELGTQTGHNVMVLDLYLMLGPTDGKDLTEQMWSNLDNLKIGLEAS